MEIIMVDSKQLLENKEKCWLGYTSPSSASSPSQET